MIPKEIDQHIIREATADHYGVYAEKKNRMWYIGRFYRDPNPIRYAAHTGDTIHNLTLPETKLGKAYSVVGQPRGIAAETFDISDLTVRFMGW